MFPEFAAIYLAEKDNRNSLLLGLKKILDAADIDHRARAEFDPRYRRLRAASRTGWLACKTTFCTLALANGMLIELLRKITGNKTVELVRENYNRPDLLTLARATSAALPPELTGAAKGDVKSKEASALEVITSMNAQNWQDSRKLLLKLSG